jgi:NADPH2:quinone reductase
VATLAQRSLSVSRPIVFHQVADQARYRASVEALFEMVASGAINVAEPQAFTLARLPDAHAALEAGKTTGATTILPEI